jgi:hypothetical protein
MDDFGTSFLPAIVTALAINALDNKILQSAVQTAAEKRLAADAAEEALQATLRKEAAEQAAREAAENSARLAKEGADAATKEAADKAAKEAAKEAAAAAAKERAAAAAAKEARDAAAAAAAREIEERAAAAALREAQEKAAAAALQKSTNIAKRRAALAGQKNAMKKAVNKSGQNFVTRVKSIFPKLNVQTQARLGAHWSKTAQSLGSDVTRLASVGAQQSAELTARMGAQKGAAAAADMAARHAAAAGAGPIGLAYDAITVVGMALDLADVGHFMQVTQTSDFLDTKKQFDSMYQNLQIDCGSTPFGPSCEGENIEGAEPRVGNFPNFYGPLDTLAQKMPSEEYERLQDGTSNVIIMSDSTDAVAIKTRTMAAMKNGKPAGCGEEWTDDCTPGMLGDITDADFLENYSLYISEEDALKLVEMTQRKMCDDNGGASFIAGPTYSDMICSYKTLASCHAAAPWPKPNNDDEDYTYTEWRAKDYFSQFKNIDGTSRLDMNAIPSGGACTTQLDALHLMCDTEKDRTVVDESLKGTYNRDTGECVNIKRYCDIKGVSYNPKMPRSQMGRPGETGTLPSCYIGRDQEVLESLIGSGTIYRFFNSSLIVEQLGAIAYTPPMITAGSVGSGNSTVDQTVAAVANGLSTGVGAVTGALSDVAQANWTGFQTGFQASTSAFISNTAGALSGQTDAAALNAVAASQGAITAANQFGNAVASGDVAAMSGAALNMAGNFAAVGISSATAVPASLVAGAASSFGTVTSGDGAAAFNNLAAQANNISAAANRLDNASNFQDVSAGLASVAAQAVALTTAAITAPIAAALAEAGAAILDIADNYPADLNNLVSSANDVQRLGESGNTNAATVAAFETAGDALTLSASATVAGVIDLARMTQCAFAPSTCRNNDWMKQDCFIEWGPCEKWCDGTSTMKQTMVKYGPSGGGTECTSAQLSQVGTKRPCGQQACPAWSRDVLSPYTSQTGHDFTGYGALWQFCKAHGIRSLGMDENGNDLGQEILYGCGGGNSESPEEKEAYAAELAAYNLALSGFSSVLQRDAVLFSDTTIGKLAQLQLEEDNNNNMLALNPNSDEAIGLDSDNPGWRDYYVNSNLDIARRRPELLAELDAQAAAGIPLPSGPTPVPTVFPNTQEQYIATARQRVGAVAAEAQRVRDAAAAAAAAAADAQRVRDAAAAAAAADAQRVRDAAAAAAAAAAAEVARLRTCPVGKYRIGTGDCQNCPVNTYKATTGASLQECIACPANSTALAGSTSDVCTCNNNYQAWADGACHLIECTGRTYAT